MGLVHFLHGDPNTPIEKKAAVTIRCGNCLRSISTVKLINGKKVCPLCLKTISPELLQKLEATSAEKPKDKKEQGKSEKKPQSGKK